MLTGCVESGRVQFAQDAFSAPVDLEDGAIVEAFVRPHDIRLEKARTQEDGAGLGRVGRLVRVGAFVKISVHLPDGDSILVQMPTHELEERGIGEGDRVVLDLRAVRVTPRLSYVI